MLHSQPSIRLRACFPHSFRLSSQSSMQRSRCKRARSGCEERPLQRPGVLLGRSSPPDRTTTPTPDQRRRRGALRKSAHRVCARIAGLVDGIRCLAATFTRGRKKAWVTVVVLFLCHVRFGAASNEDPGNCPNNTVVDADPPACALVNGKEAATCMKRIGNLNYNFLTKRRHERKLDDDR